MMLHANAATLRGLTYFHFVAYIMLFLEIIVYRIPPGGGGSIASAMPRELHLTFWCDMGLPCSTSNNSKSIYDRNVMFAFLKN